MITIRATAWAFLALTAATEKGCDKEIPIWRGKIYVGNSLEGTIERKQDGESISTKDPQFDQFFCLSKEDYDCFFNVYIVQCKEWKKQEACGLEESNSGKRTPASPDTR